MCRLDHGFRKAVCRYLAVFPDLHKAGERKLFRTFVERADSVAHIRRKHRKNPVREIHARAALVSIRIKRCSGLHIMAHIRNMHAKQPPILELYKGDSIVKVLCIRTIDGNSWQVPQILTPRNRIRIDRFVQAACLADRCFCKRFGQIQTANHGKDVRPCLILPAKHLGNFSHQRAAAVRILRNLCDNLIAMLCASCCRLIHQHIHIEPRIVRNPVPAGRTVALFKRAHNSALRTHSDQHNLRFRAAVAADRLRWPYPNLVAMHCAVHRIRGHEHIGAAILRDKEAISAGIALHAPIDESRLFRQRQFAFTRQNQPAFRKQAFHSHRGCIALLRLKFF